jgi:hypothetical protein
MALEGIAGLTALACLAIIIVVVIIFLVLWFLFRFIIAFFPSIVVAVIVWYITKSALLGLVAFVATALIFAFLGSRRRREGYYRY